MRHALAILLLLAVAIVCLACNNTPAEPAATNDNPSNTAPANGVESTPVKP